jgi:GT2 family glycosyltransferase
MMVDGAEPLVSLVVLSYDKYDATTGACLATLAPALADPRFELVLVDNASPDGSGARCAAFAAEHPGVVWLPQAENLGFGGGMNAGAAAARGAWICLVNSDTLFPEGALDALARTLQAAPEGIAMLGPVTNAAGNGQCLPLPGVPLDRVPAIGAAAMRAPTGLLTPTYRTDFFCVAVRRDAWQRLGGLDPVFGLGYYEDFDFSLRLAAAGFGQAIAEDVFVAHVGSSSFATMGSRQKALMRRNRGLIKRRHPRIRFEHVRHGNAAALRYLVETAERGGWNDALRHRAAWRLAALLSNEPRSPLKRWWWRWGNRRIRRALAEGGIEPAFPAASPADARPLAVPSRHPL